MAFDFLNGRTTGTLSGDFKKYGPDSLITTHKIKFYIATTALVAVGLPAALGIRAMLEAPQDPPARTSPQAETICPSI